MEPLLNFFYYISIFFCKAFKIPKEKKEIIQLQKAFSITLANILLGPDTNQPKLYFDEPFRKITLYDRQK